MRATLMYGAGDVRVEDVPAPVLQETTDAVVRVVRACVCGSDLHPYHGMPQSSTGTTMGHEFLGVVEQTGPDVTTIRVGDLVVASFSFQDNTCPLCRDGVQTACLHGGFFSTAQAEQVRVPQADGTLVAVPVGEDSPLLPSLLTLADVYGTGYHAAHQARVQAGDTVAVIGDGAVGLLAVLSAKQLGAEQIILMGRHTARTDLGREFGATDVVAARGDEGIAAVRDLTGGLGAHKVLEAVGHRPAYDQAVGIVRAGGTISRVGVPQYEDAPVGFNSLFGRNITLTGGPAPVRAYIEQLLPAVLDGSVDPGRVFDQTVALQDIAAGYQAMDDRTALKVRVTPCPTPDPAAAGHPPAHRLGTEAPRMKIAVIGTGAVGRTLAAKLDQLGHDVAVGTRDVETTLAADGDDQASFRDWQQDHPAVRLLPFAEAGAHGTLVLNAVNGANAVDAMRAVGADVLAGKVLLDLALPLDLSGGFPPALTISGEDSLAEQIQAALPDTRVVKSLNTVYMEVMVDPGRVPGDHTLFVSGDDADAKTTVRELLQQFGWPAARIIDLGALSTARGVEKYSMLFFALYGVLGTFDFNIAIARP